MNNLRFIARESFNHQAYTVLGVSKKDIREATVQWGKRRLVDCTRLAEITKRSEQTILFAAQAAKLTVENIDLEQLTGQSNPLLIRLKEMMDHLGLIRDRVHWKRGFEALDPRARDQLYEISRLLVEALAEQAGVPVWALTNEHIMGTTRTGAKAIKLNGIDMVLSGMMNYFLHQPDRNGREAVVYLLGKLGFGRFRDLSIEQQLAVIKSREKPSWEKVPVVTQRYLIEALAKKLRIPIWGLKIKQLKSEPMDEIGTALSGLVNYYSCHPERGKKEVMQFILEKLGYGKFEDLAIEEQLEGLKHFENIQWERVPLPTERYLVELLAKKAGVSVWGLLTEHFWGNFDRGLKPIHLPEIDASLVGLNNYYNQLKEKGERDVIEFMLEKLGFGKFEDLPVEQQLVELKALKNIIWDRVSIPTRKHLIELLAAKAGVSVWSLRQAHFTGDQERDLRPITIDEIGKTLGGLIDCYEREIAGTGKSGVPHMLERCGFGRFEDLPIDQQLLVIKDQETIRWENVPVRVQRFLVERLAQQLGVSVWGLKQDDFVRSPKGEETPVQVAEISSGIGGMFARYQHDPERKGRRTVDYLLEKLGFGMSPFNSAGRLFASSRAHTPAFSLFMQLNITRQLIRDWRELYGSRPITEIGKVEIEKIVHLKKEIYEGMFSIFRGNSHNVFELNYIDLICRALQHLTMDEIEPGYRPSEVGASNALLPNLFPSYSRSGAESAKPVRLVGYYQTKGRDAELPLLVALLEKKIASANGRGSRDIGIEEGLFDTKWLETQQRALEGIARRLEEKKTLPAPLLYALGLQGETAETQPKPAEVDMNGLKVNPAQSYAARLILEDFNPLVMIHGPAGSGKTHMLMRAIDKLVRSGKKVLYVTPTHKATDVLLERVDRATAFVDLPVLRLGVSDGKLSETAKKYWVRDHQAKDEFKKRRAMSDKQGMLFVGTIAGGVHFLIDQGAEAARRSLFSERMQGVEIFRDIKDYDVVIIDEASMASKPEVYAALALAKRAVIIGDHVQLEPFPLEKPIVDELKLNERQAESVQRSLLEQLMFDEYPHVLLEMNYRAINPAMIVLASRIFYDERIRVNQASPYFSLAKEERAKQYPTDSLKIVDTSDLSYEKKAERFSGKSYYNEIEADLAVKQIKDYLSQGFQLEDIAVITPYSAQVELIRKRIKAAVPEATEEYLQRWVSTFDGFQGDESKCVIISFVRGNLRKPPETGFVGNYHRVNVGITRAQERMALIGDWATLKKTGNGETEKAELSDVLSLQTRHIFEELELQVQELQEEGRAVIEKL